MNASTKKYTAGQQAGFDALRAKFEAGDEADCKMALLLALEIASECKCEIPAWAAGHIVKAIRDFRFARYRTLDEAFGVARPKGFSLNSENKRLNYIWSVHVAVQDRTENGNNLETAIEAVAKDFGFSESDVKRLYYEAKKLLE